MTVKYRVGIGFDSHLFEEGKTLILGGVRIDFPKGLKGHSDGDVILHAITDAILGALGEPDIGELFSDKDKRWEGVPSEVFLKEAIKRASKKGFRFVNLDCIVIADEPKISLYKEKIKGKLAELIGISKEFISVKGKRKEGFSSEEGIACLCCVLLESADES